MFRRWGDERKKKQSFLPCFLFVHYFYACMFLLSLSFIVLFLWNSSDGALISSELNNEICVNWKEEEEEWMRERGKERERKRWIQNWLNVQRQSNTHNFFFSSSNRNSNKWNILRPQVKHLKQILRSQLRN